MSCCETATHCANVRGKDDAALNASMKILCDLADLNQSLYNRLNKNNVEFVFTGDLLAGQANCSMDVLMEVLTYLYTDECQITLNNVMQLFETADLFGIDRLKFMCEQAIINNIDTENASAILHASD